MQWLLALTALGYAASTVTRLLAKMAIGRGKLFDSPFRSAFLTGPLGLALAARRQQWVVGPRWSMLTIAGVIASLSVLLVDRGTHWSAT